VALVCALGLAIATVAGTDPAGDRSTWAFPAIRTLNEQVRKNLPEDGPYYVQDRGGMAYLSLANPLILDLIRHGYDVRLGTNREPSLGTFRRVDPRDLKGIVLVTSGKFAGSLPKGTKLLAHVPVGPKTPATDDTATSYPVNVYLLPPSALKQIGGYQRNAR
jgi:hypothetical protein